MTIFRVTMLVFLVVLGVVAVLFFAPFKRAKLSDSEKKVQKVIFIPGWKTNNEPQDDQRSYLQRIYPEADIEIEYWDSNRMWYKAKENALNFSKKLAKKLLVNKDQLSSTVLVGHSLGGRIAVKTLKHLQVDEVNLHTVILLGAAIDVDDEDVKKLDLYAEKLNTSVINLSNEGDFVLKAIYSFMEQTNPLGYLGPKIEMKKVRNYRIPRKYMAHDVNGKNLLYSSEIWEDLTEDDMRDMVKAIDQDVPNDFQDSVDGNDDGLLRANTGGFRFQIERFLGITNHYSAKYLSYLMNIL
jgi:predicted alpha/beta hydrolase family esterase